MSTSPRCVPLRCSLVLATLAATGCASRFEMVDVAKNHAVADLGCPEQAVHGVSTGHRMDIGLRGCGRWIVYRCMWSSAGGAQCFPTAQGDEKAASAP